MKDIAIKAITLTREYILDKSIILEDGVSFDNYVVDNEFLSYGATTSGQLTVSYINDLITIPWKEVDRVEYYIDDKLQYIGFFEDIEVEDDTVKVTFLDLLVKLNEPYLPQIHNIFANRRVDNILHSILNIVINESLYTGFTIIDNFTLSAIPTVSIINETDLEAVTLGEIARWCLEILGAVLFVEGKNIIIKSPQVSSFEITTSLYKEPLKVFEENLNISGVEIYKEVEKENGGKKEIVDTIILSGNNLRPYTISNNPFALLNADQSWADNLYNRDKTLSWRPLVVSIDFDNINDVHFFDIITVKDEITSYKCLITHLSYSHDGDIRIESVGSNWKPEINNIGRKTYRNSESEKRLIKRNIELIGNEMTLLHQNFTEKFDQERQERIDSVNSAIDLAINSPVTETRITNNSIKTSHIKVDAIDSSVIKVDNALVAKLTTDSLLAKAVWAKVVSANLITSDIISANLARLGNFNISQVLRSNNDGRGRYLQLDGRGDYDFLSAGYIDAQGASKPWTRIDKDGKFYAMAGEIGGWQINTNYLRHENASRVIQLDPRGGTPPIYVGTKSGEVLTPQFQVLDNGSVYVKNGGVIGNWEVTPDGRLIGGKHQGVTIQLDPRGLYSPIQYNVGSVNYFSVNKDGSVYSRAMNANGSFTGSSYGYGSFSSGDFNGNGRFSSGMTVGGISLNANGNVLTINQVSSSFVTTDALYSRHGINTYDTGTSSGVVAKIYNKQWSISNSDIRLKENIKELGHEYDGCIYTMPLITYTLIEDKNHTPRVGVNANLLMKTLPEYMAKSFLHKDPVTGLYGANYELLVPYVIKAVQANHEEINELKEEIRRLKNGKNS